MSSVLCRRISEALLEQWPEIASASTIHLRDRLDAGGVKVSANRLNSLGEAHFRPDQAHEHKGVRITYQRGTWRLEPAEGWRQHWKAQA